MFKLFDKQTNEIIVLRGTATLFNSVEHTGRNIELISKKELRERQENDRQKQSKLSHVKESVKNILEKVHRFESIAADQDMVVKINPLRPGK